MTEPREEWQNVGDTVSALLLKLKLHAEEELSDEDLRERSGLDRVSQTVREVFDAIGDAYEDEAVRADAKDVGSALARAIDSSVRSVTARIRP